MGIGAVNQVVYIGKLPEGVTMTITDVKLKVPDTPNCDWWPTFLGNKKLLTKNSSPETKSEIFPYTVDPSADDGKIGEIGLSTLNMTDSGPGPSVDIEFTFTGAVQVGDKHCPVDQKGQITVSTTDWGTFWGGIVKFAPYARPDTTFIAYSIAGSGIETKSNKNDDLQSPRGILIVADLDISTSTVQFAMNAEIIPDTTKTAIDYALKGIFYGHKKAIGWVVKGLL